MPTRASRKASSWTPAFPAAPALGEPLDLGKGLSWLRMPLPFELNHINLWLLEGPAGWTLVDTGFHYAETLQHWEKLFAARFAQKPVETIFITHFHPDHFGLAGFLAERTGLTVRMAQAEFDIARRLAAPGDLSGLEADYRAYYAEAGLEEAERESLVARRFSYRKMVGAVPAAIAPVAPGETVTLAGRPWKIVGGYGHSPAHCCLYDAAAKYFIAGDIVLPTITPNISFYPGSHGDPVGAYLESLDDIERQVPDDAIVLPSHGEPFTGLRARLAEIRAHHTRRFERLHAVLAAGPQTARQAMVGLFSHRELAGSDVFFALGETIAHLVHEQLRGRVVRTVESGRALYARA